jgi:uncharacterized protein YjgD (DUF1641 family)
MKRGVFRGAGGTGDATTDASIASVTTKSLASQTSAEEAAASAVEAAASASGAAADRASTLTLKNSIEGYDTATSADAIATAADLVQTNQDTIDTAADVVTTNENVGLVAANKALTGGDRIQTALDRAATTQDVADTVENLTLTNADVVLTHADELLTRADTVLTAADVVLAEAAKEAAEAAQAAAEAAYDNVDDIYLGAKSENPSVDNDGDNLTEGVWYFNTTDLTTLLYNGTTWDRISTPANGVATLDFGSGNVSAEVVVTGVSDALTTSNVMCQLRVEATAEHPVDDLLIDPIRLLVKDLVAGTGFTIYGHMDNARANGTYKVQWLLN